LVRRFKKTRNDLVLSTKDGGLATKEEALAQLVNQPSKNSGNRFRWISVYPARQKTSCSPARCQRRPRRGAADRQGGRHRSASPVVSTHSGQKELIPFLATNPNIDVDPYAIQLLMEPFMNEVMTVAAAGERELWR
jgi:hypothetical protein